MRATCKRENYVDFLEDIYEAARIAVRSMTATLAAVYAICRADAYTPCSNGRVLRMHEVVRFSRIY